MMIRKTILILCFVILLAVNVSAIERTMFIEDYKIVYSYDEAEEGEKFTLTVEITNEDEDNEKTNVVFELDEEGPFDIKSEDRWVIGTLGAEEEVTETFRIEVDDDTLEDEYDLEFTLEDDDDDFIDEVEIEVGSENADLIVGHVTSVPSIISADLEDIKLTIKIDNLGGGDAKFVRARLELPEGFNPSSSFSDSVDIGIIASKDNAEAVFFIDSSVELTSGNHVAVLALDYKDGVGLRTSKLNFDLPVKGRPLFSIASSSTSPRKVSSGGEGQLSIKIWNSGNEEGKETSVRVFENSDFPIDFDEKTNFVGSLKPVEEGTAVFKFDVENDAELNTYNIKVQTRTLNEGNILVEEFSVPIIVVEKEGGIMGNNLFVAVLIVIIIVVVYFVYRMFKK